MSARAVLGGDALIVRLADHGESDKVVGLFVRELGLLTAIAKGARRSQRRFAGALQTGQRVAVELVLGNGTLARLESATLVEAHLGLSTDLGRLTEASVLLRAIREHLAEREPDAALFDELLAHLGALSADRPSAIRLVVFRLRLFDRLGVGPELERCVVCGRAAPEERSGAFDARKGGLVCRACGGGPLVVGAASRSLARLARSGAPLPEGLDEALAVDLAGALDALAQLHLARRSGG